MKDDLAGLIFENTSYFLGLLNPSGILLRANRLSLELIKSTEEEVLGKYFWDCPWWTHSPEQQEILKASILKAARGESSYFETTHIDYQGITHHVLFSIKPVRAKDNTVEYLIPEGQDVTRQHEIEQNLLESELKYRNLFDMANDAIFLMKDNIFIDCNAKTLEMFGCKREEIIGNTPYFFSPEFQSDGRLSNEKAKEKIHKALNEGGQIFEWRHQKKNKEIFEAEVSLNLVKAGGQNYLLAIVRDISIRKNIENALRLSEQKFNRIFNQSPVAIVLSEVETAIILDVNAAFEEIFLFKKEEVIGHASTELGIVSPETRAKAREGIIKAGRVKGAEIIYRNKNGDDLYCLGSADIMEIEGKKVVLQSITDISSLIKANEKLKESEARFKSIFELSPLAIALVDFKNGNFIDVNSALLKSYNKSRDEMVGKSSFDLVKFTDISRREEYREALTKDGRVINFEIELLGEGRPDQILLMTSFIAKLGNESILINISNNITEIRNYQKELLKYQGQLEKMVMERTEKINSQNQELLQLNEELISSNDQLNSRKAELENALDDLKKAQSQLVLSEKMASLGTLVAGIAHELNNPLNFISSGLNLMEMNISEDSPADTEELEAAYSMMKKGLANSSNILKALMTYSYHGQSIRHEIDLHEVIDNTLLFINSSLPKGTKIIKDFQLDRRVTAHPEKLHQVFINILTNGIFEISKLPVDVPRLIKISTARKSNESDNLAVVEFFNSGSHIDEIHFNHIFDPFYTTKQPGEGTGLGLSISFALIKEHNGSIKAKNLPDGVVFIIELPI